MKRFSATIVRASCFAFLFSAALPTLAGAPVVITTAPANIGPVPALSAPFLIMLAVLLAIVALRFRKSDANRSLPVIAACAIAATASGGIGIKLFSEAQAVASQTLLENPEGQAVGAGLGGTCLINASGVALDIVNISLDTDVVLLDTGGSTCEDPGVSDGSYQGFCSDSPRTFLAPTDRCFVNADLLLDLDA